MTKHTIILPTINLNGTSARELLQLQINACNAISQAIEALQAAAPHGRDYQSSPNPYAFSRAQEEHRNRLTKLEQVQRELQAIGEHISDSVT